ncbi:MAG TPA: DivIVA domain-containing protein [Actinomycetales bacterium]|nr:DivIVA domain-containing protein [Actinomycetales bacterium]
MNLVSVLVVLAVLGVVAAVVTGAIHAEMDEPTSNLPPAGVPDGELVAEDLQAVRFSLGFRGYRMDEVDEVLDRASAELARRDAEIDRLRSLLGHQPLAAAGATHASGNGTARPSWEDVPEHHGRHLRADTPSTQTYGPQPPSADDWASHEPATNDSAHDDSALHDSALHDSAADDSAAHDSALHDSAADDTAAHDSALHDSAADDSAAHDSTPAEVRAPDGRPAAVAPASAQRELSPSEGT